MKHVCAECGGRIYITVEFTTELDLDIDPETGKVWIEDSDLAPRNMSHDILYAYCTECGRNDVDVQGQLTFEGGQAFARINEFPAEESDESES